MHQNSQTPKINLKFSVHQTFQHSKHQNPQILKTLLIVLDQDLQNIRCQFETYNIPKIAILHFDDFEKMIETRSKKLLNEEINERLSVKNVTPFAKVAYKFTKNSRT